MKFFSEYRLLVCHVFVSVLIINIELLKFTFVFNLKHPTKPTQTKRRSEPSNELNLFNLFKHFLAQESFEEELILCENFSVCETSNNGSKLSYT